MLKVNLLPPYIYERRRIRQAAFLAGLVFVMILASMLSWWYTLGKTQARLAQEVQDMEQKRDLVLALEQLAKAEEERIPPVQQKLDFIEGVLAYNLKAPKLYEELARFTYGRIMYRSIQPAADALTIQAYARSVGDCGRFLLNMYQASHLFSSVAISAVPGYPSGGEGGPGRGFDFTVTCKLVEPFSPPSYGGVTAEGPTIEGAAVPGGPVAPAGPAAPAAPSTSFEEQRAAAESAPPPGLEEAPE